MATVPSDPAPLRAAAVGALVRVLIAPKASRNSAVMAAREAAVKVSVTAAPGRGKADQAFVMLFAKVQQIPPGRFPVVADDPGPLSHNFSNGRETPHDPSTAN